jgi:hypothetical protein
MRAPLILYKNTVSFDNWISYSQIYLRNLVDTYKKCITMGFMRSKLRAYDVLEKKTKIDLG